MPAELQSPSEIHNELRTIAEFLVRQTEAMYHKGDHFVVGETVEEREEWTLDSLPDFSDWIYSDLFKLVEEIYREKVGEE